MNNTEKPENTNQTAEGEDGARQNETLYDRFVEKTKVLFELGQEKSEQAWEKAIEVTRKQMATAGEFSSAQSRVRCSNAIYGTISKIPWSTCAKWA